MRESTPSIARRPCSFSCEEMAARAYDVAVLKLSGVKTNLNFGTVLPRSTLHRQTRLYQPQAPARAPGVLLSWGMCLLSWGMCDGRCIRVRRARTGADEGRAGGGARERAHSAVQECSQPLLQVRLLAHNLHHSTARRGLGLSVFAWLQVPWGVEHRRGEVRVQVRARRRLSSAVRLLSLRVAM